MTGELKLQTTLIKKKNDMPSQEFAHCHEGVGSILWTGVLDHQDPGGEILHFIHDDVLPPGTSIGIHQHTDETEYYYIISAYAHSYICSYHYHVSSYSHHYYTSSYYYYYSPSSYVMLSAGLLLFVVLSIVLL